MGCRSFYDEHTADSRCNGIPPFASSRGRCGIRDQILDMFGSPPDGLICKYGWVDVCDRCAVCSVPWGLWMAKKQQAAPRKTKKRHHHHSSQVGRKAPSSSKQPSVCLLGLERWWCLFLCPRGDNPAHIAIRHGPPARHADVPGYVCERGGRVRASQRFVRFVDCDVSISLPRRENCSKS